MSMIINSQYSHAMRMVSKASTSLEGTSIKRVTVALTIVIPQPTLDIGIIILKLIKRFEPLIQ